MGQAEERTEVVVVGAGPVGLMLAGELRLGGARVTVVDRLPEPMDESRASQLNARTMEILDQRGLLHLFGDLRPEPAGHFGGIPLLVDHAPSVHAGYWKVPQPRTEAALAGWAVGLGAEIRRGHEVRDLVQADDHVDLELTGPDGPVALRAGHVVGCDGEHSTVRRLAGIEFAGHAARRELVRADVAGIDVSTRRFHRFPRGLAVAGRTGGDLTRVMFHEFGRPVAGRTAPPSFAEVARSWRRITGEDIGGGTPTWVDVFGDVDRQATRYRSGRVLLAGDAAHAQMPASGQALNLGLQDAVNLGWKLAARVRGGAPRHLLDSYHDERHPVGARVLRNVAVQTDLLLGGPELDAMRSVFDELLRLDDTRLHLATLLGGLDVRYGLGPGGDPLVGARLPHAELLTDNGRTVTTAALLHPARGVLLDLAADAADRDRLHAAAAPWGDRVDTVVAKADGAGTPAGATAVLVRPDGHVAWSDGAADGSLGGSEDLEAALRRWFGAPAT